MTMMVGSHHYGDNFGFSAAEETTICFLPVDLLNEKTATAAEVLYTKVNFNEVGVNI
jgi:hypothetical protein